MKLETGFFREKVADGKTKVTCQLCGLCQICDSLDDCHEYERKHMRSCTYRAHFVKTLGMAA